MSTDGTVARRPWWALVVAAVASTAAAWLLVTGGAAAPDSATAAAPMLQVAPGGSVDLATLPHATQAIYRAAAADPGAFAEVRCYCGCETFLDHRHLLDCFVRPAGGWERHATGCGVCLAEAEQVIAMRADGTPIDEIVRQIDDRFGAITAPTGT